MSPMSPMSTFPTPFFNFCGQHLTLVCPCRGGRRSSPLTCCPLSNPLAHPLHIQHPIHTHWSRVLWPLCVALPLVRQHVFAFRQESMGQRRGSRPVQATHCIISPCSSHGLLLGNRIIMRDIVVGFQRCHNISGNNSNCGANFAHTAEAIIHHKLKCLTHLQQRSLWPLFPGHPGQADHFVGPIVDGNPFHFNMLASGRN